TNNMHTYGVHIARTWDMPEGNPAALNSGIPGYAFTYAYTIGNQDPTTTPPPNWAYASYAIYPPPFTSSYNPYIKDESWLASTCYRFAAAQFHPSPGPPGFSPL